MKQIFFGIFLLLSSCATNYYAKTWYTDGGYSDYRLSENKFVVTSRGNTITDPEDVMKYALYRASEVCVENGYKYFSILSEKDISKEELHFQERSKELLPWDHYEEKVFKNKKTRDISVDSRQKPGIYLLIQCYTERPTSDDEINAVSFLQYNSL